jgi:hypothetical protein
LMEEAALKMDLNDHPIARTLSCLVQGFLSRAGGKGWW